MPTQITSAGITFNDTTSLTSANIGTAQLVNGSVTAAKLGTNEQKQIAKAWVNFNGTGTIGTNQTIRSSYNVSSVTKNGTGDYTVNFATALADANYVTQISSEYTWVAPASGVKATNIYSGSQTTNSVRIQTLLVNSGLSSNVIDSSIVAVSIFGN